jgi:uncharacterized protein
VRVLLLTVICASGLIAQKPAPQPFRNGQGRSAQKAAAVKHLDVKIPMRDGVNLAGNVFLPSARGRFPVILERTPYGKGKGITQGYQAFLDKGYAVVVQDVRGRYGSEGIFDPLTQESADGEDTLKWIAHQPWFRTGIGMVGGSYRGIVQWKAALSRSPHLKAIFPVVAGWDDYQDRFYSKGGAMKLGYRLEWMSENMKTPGYHADFNKYIFHLPIRTADVVATGHPTYLFQEITSHPAYDSFWRKISTRERISDIRIPVFAVGGWYDNFVESDVEAFGALRKTNPTNRLVIGPWPHSMSYRFPNVDFGPDSMIPVLQYQLAWFDRWLLGKDSPLLSGPPLKIFVMGSNSWREDDEWPPDEARLRVFYLKSGGQANSIDGDGELSDTPALENQPDRFIYDPHKPVPTNGGAVCCNPQVFPWGPKDQQAIERRPDVLVYTSRKLSRDLEVVGPVKAAVYVSTSARDTDFTAKLVDVFPDGTARNLCDGILRLRYRDSLEHPQPARQGEVYRIVIDAGVTANVFLKGHRIRLEISSSNFPRFDRNTNTGGRIADETKMFTAAQTVYHDRAHPSQLMLMAMPAHLEAHERERVASLRGTRPLAPGR